MPAQAVLEDKPTRIVNLLIEKVKRAGYKLAIQTVHLRINLIIAP